jgi:hypothetical protein
MTSKIGGGAMLTANKIDTSREILRAKDALQDDRAWVSSRSSIRDEKI